MLTNLVVIFLQLAPHGLFDVLLKATGDIQIDGHQTNEDGFCYEDMVLESRTFFTILG